MPVDEEEVKEDGPPSDLKMALFSKQALKKALFMALVTQLKTSAALCLVDLKLSEEIFTLKVIVAGENSKTSLTGALDRALTEATKICLRDNYKIKMAVEKWASEREKGLEPLFTKRALDERVVSEIEQDAYLTTHDGSGDVEMASRAKVGLNQMVRHSLMRFMEASGKWVVCFHGTQS